MPAVKRKREDAKAKRTSKMPYAKRKKTAKKTSSANTTYKVWVHGVYQCAGTMTGAAQSQQAGPLAGGQGYGNYVSFAIGASIDNITQAKNLAQVFERVKVHKMKVEVFPLADSYNAQAAGAATTGSSAVTYQVANNWMQASGGCIGSYYPVIASYIDIDDIGQTLPNPTQVFSHPDAWPKPFNKVHTRTFVPGITTQIETTGVTAASGGTIRSNTIFINTNTARAAQLSGMKFCIMVPGAAGQCFVTVNVAVHLLLEFQGLNYTSQPDKLAALLVTQGKIAALPPPAEEHDGEEESSDDLDEDQAEQYYAHGFVYPCKIHKRIHSDGRQCRK